MIPASTPPSTPLLATVAESVVRPLIDLRYGSEESNSIRSIRSESQESVSLTDSVERREREPTSASVNHQPPVPVTDIFDGTNEQRLRNSLRNKGKRPMKIHIKTKEEALQEKWTNWGKSRLTLELLQDYVHAVDPEINLSDIDDVQKKFDRMLLVCQSALKYLEFFLAQSTVLVERTLLQKGIGTVGLRNCLIERID